MKLVIMKIRDIFYFGLLLFSSLQGYSQEISLAGNGVTIIANASAVTGNSYLLGGINYKVVDDASIADEIAANNYNIVTTRVTDMSNQFKDKNAFDMLRVNGLLEIAPMSFIRGRTFTNSYIILDEAQNATIHELKTVITRVGEGSKIVLMGDTDQIDTTYLNKHTNGLSLVTKKLRDSLHTAHVDLPVGIRSTIASEASHLL